MAKNKILAPVRPNAGLEALFRRRLLRFVDAMNKSVQFWVKQSYKANPPVMAQDESPAEALRKSIKKLGKRWQRNFDEMAPKLAEYFATSAAERSDATLKAILRKGGFSVKFQMTPAMRDILDATISEQVNLIKSIPQKYLTDVEGIVMRGVQTGRDVGQVSRDLQNAYGVTRRRAGFIARDQLNKATASMNRARQTELGIKKAIWVHSHGGKTPRPTHLANDGNEYDVSKGWYDKDADGKGKGRWIFPGELPNCRCVSRSVIKGFT